MVLKFRVNLGWDIIDRNLHEIWKAEVKQPPCLCLRVGVGAVSQHVFSVVLFTGVFSLCLFTSLPHTKLFPPIILKLNTMKQNSVQLC